MNGYVLRQCVNGLFGQGVTALFILLPFRFLRAPLGTNFVAMLFMAGIVPVVNSLVYTPYFPRPVVLGITTLIGVEYNRSRENRMHDQIRRSAPCNFLCSALFSGLPLPLLESMRRTLSSFETFATELATFLVLRGISVHEESLGRFWRAQFNRALVLLAKDCRRTISQSIALQSFPDRRLTRGACRRRPCIGCRLEVHIEAMRGQFHSTMGEKTRNIQLTI
jgi:hypothetical protein